MSSDFTMLKAIKIAQPMRQLAMKKQRKKDEGAGQTLTNLYNISNYIIELAGLSSSRVKLGK